MARNLWTREELIVTLALYFQLPFGRLNHGTQYHFRCNAPGPDGSAGPMDVYITQPESNTAFFTLMGR